MKEGNSRQLLMEFSTDESRVLDDVIKDIFLNNPQYNEKYVVDGIGYFVLTFFETNFCHIDVYVLKETDLDSINTLTYFLQAVINKICRTIQKNEFLKKNKKGELLLAKYFKGEYSCFEIKNNIIQFNDKEEKNEKKTKKYFKALTYSIGIDTINHSKEEIINLGFWLSHTLKNIYDELLKFNMSGDEFVLYYYNLIISKLNFLKEYYEKDISTMNNDDISRYLYYLREDPKTPNSKIENSIPIIDDQLVF